MATIDLSQLPAPDVVEELDYENLFEERKSTLISLYPADQQEAISRTLTLESEPLVKLLQENAYRELILRQRINESARAVMVAYATGNDLDQLAANFNVERLVLRAADNATDRRRDGSRHRFAYAHSTGLRRTERRRSDRRL